MQQALQIVTRRKQDIAPEPRFLPVLVSTIERALEEEREAIPQRPTQSPVTRESARPERIYSYD